MSKERKVMLILDIIFTILTAVVVIVMQATEGWDVWGNEV